MSRRALMLRALTAGATACACIAVEARAQQSRSAVAASPLMQATARESRFVRLIQKDKVSLVPAEAVSTVQLAPGQFLGQRTANAPRFELRARQLGTVVASGQPKVDTLTVLPFAITGNTIANKRVRLRPVVIPEGLGYDRVNKSFAGSVLIALENQDAPDVNEQLSGPIRINVSAQGDSVSPAELDVTHTNLPPIRVSIRARAPLDSIPMRIIPTFDMRGENVWLAVRPTLLIPNLPRRAAGLGIATVPFQVTVSGRTFRDSLRVSVSTDAGTLDREQVMIPPGGSAIVQLRSEGTDSATVKVSSPGIAGAEETIHFEWPIVFLVCALAGGGVGGLAAQLSRRRKRGGTLGRATLIGNLIGFVVAIVYRALGINLIAMHIPALHTDEAAVFAFALLGGALGIPAFVHSRDVARNMRTPVVAGGSRTLGE